MIVNIAQVGLGLGHHQTAILYWRRKGSIERWPGKEFGQGYADPGWGFMGRFRRQGPTFDPILPVEVLRMLPL